MTDLADLTLTEASRLLAAREISAVELVKATLLRIDRTEEALHCYAHRFDDDALAAARRADAEPARGPLHGIPFAVKDTLYTAGTPSEAGSASMAGHLGPFDATVVARLHAAGAILIGKHVTHEFAQGQEDSGVRNPWALDRFAGGSSAGSGSSVAAGSAFLAVATDAGGSTRMPAALTGTVGFKGTYGLLSTYGTVPGGAVPGAEHIGLITRSSEDLGLVLPAVTGPDPHDVRTAGTNARDLTPDGGRAGDLSGIRIGVLRRVHPEQPVDEAVDRAFDASTLVLESLGATLVQLELDLRLASPAMGILVGASASAPHLKALRNGGDGLHPEVKHHLQAGLLIPAPFVAAARNVRTLLRQDIAGTFRAQRLNALITPSLPCIPPLLHEFDPARDMGALTAFNSIWNLTGQPAVTVPAGLLPDGLPAGVQFVGAPFDESTLLRIASAFEALSPRPVPPLVKKLRGRG